jgi:hypothetical protein
MAGEGDEWWMQSDRIPDVESDRVGSPRPIGILGPDGREIHRIQPVGFNRIPQLVYVKKRGD